MTVPTPPIELAGTATKLQTIAVEMSATLVAK